MTKRGERYQGDGYWPFIFYAILVVLAVAFGAGWALTYNRSSTTVVLPNDLNASIVILSRIVNDYALSITQKDMQRNVELFDGAVGRVQMHRLMTFLTTGQPMPLTQWQQEMDNFQQTLRTNQMMLSDVSITFPETAVAAYILAAGHYSYMLDVGNSSFAPAVLGYFTIAFNATLVDHEWKLTNAESLVNATNIFLHNSNTGVQPPGPLLTRKRVVSRSLSDWTLLLDQQAALYLRDHSAALALCNTTYYKELQALYSNGLELCFTAQRDVIQLSGPLVCDAFSLIDPSCLDTFNVTTGIATINVIQPVPATKDFTLMGVQGIEISGDMHGLTFKNTGVLSLSIDNVPPEFNVTATMAAIGNVSVSFGKAHMPLGNQVWATDPTGLPNTPLQVRYLVAADIPTLPMSKLSGVLSVSQGGTGSGTPLVGGRIMFSTSNQTLVEMQPQLGLGELITGDGAGNLVIAQLIGSNGIHVMPYVNGTIEIRLIEDETNEVKSVGLIAPSQLFFVSGSPVTSIGNLTFDLLPQLGGLIFASGTNPNATSVPGWRALAVSDLPSSIPTSLLSGILSVANGGTGSGTALVGNRLMVSTATTIVEASALLSGQLMMGVTGGAPIPGYLSTANGNLLITNGPGSIQLEVIINVSQAVGTLSTLNGGTGVTSLPTNQILLGGSTLTGAGALLNGQLLIGVTGGAPTPAYITAGNGVNIVTGPAYMEISATGVCTNGTKFSQSCLDISSVTCAFPVDNSCIPSHLSSNTLNVAGTTFLGTQTFCSQPMDLSCIPVNDVHFISATIDNLTVLNITQVNTIVYNGTSFSVDEFFVEDIHMSGGMVCLGNATISETCFPPTATYSELTVVDTFYVGDIHCQTPINKTCLDIDNLECVTPLQYSCIPLVLRTVNGVAPHSMTGDLLVQAGAGVSVVSIVNGISIVNTGVLSVSLSPPSSIFNIVTGTVNTNSGTLSFVLKPQANHEVFIGTGLSSDPIFRLLTVPDMPAIPSGAIMIGTGIGQVAANLTASTGISIVQGPGYVQIAATGLQDISLTVPSALLTVSPATITATTGGVFSVSLQPQLPRTVFMGNAINTTTPSFRLMETTDMPYMPINYVLVGTGLGTPPVPLDLYALTVTSVNLNMPTNIFTVTLVDPAPDSVTLNITLVTQPAGYVWAADPLIASAPYFRLLNYTDLPDFIRTVGLSLPVDLFTVSNSPLTGTGGTLFVSKVPQLANLVYASALTGGPSLPGFRALGYQDFTALNLGQGQLLGGTSSGTPTAVSLRAGSGIVLTTSVNGEITVSASNNTEVIGTVTSVCLAAPGNLFSFSPSCITTNGTFNLVPLTQPANKIIAGPDGVSGYPTARYMVLRDMPVLDSYQIYLGDPLVANQTIQATLVAGTYMNFSYTSGQLTINNEVSVGLSLPTNVFSVTNTPTAQGTLTATFITQSPRQFLASPLAGSGPLAVRGIGYADLPALLDGQLYIGQGGTAVAATLAAGFGITITPGPGTLTVSSSITGTVTSVGLALPAALFAVTGSPVTGAGTLTAAFIAVPANAVLIGPTTGANAVPTVRLLVAGDIPNLDTSKLTTGILPIARGGTNSGTALANGRIMVSSGGAIREAASMPAGSLMIGTGTGYAIATITAGTGMNVVNTAGGIQVVNTGVTSVGFSAPAALFSVTNSPVTTTGTLTISLVNQLANTVFAGLDGLTGLPTFRLLVSNDIPNLNAAKITTGILPIARGGTNSGTALVNGRLMVSFGGAIVEMSTMSNGFLPIGNGAGYTLAGITGTANQVNVANGAGSITLSLPQNIHTAATPTFDSMSLTATSNQLILGTTRTITLTAPTPATSSRVYTFPDASSDANVVLSTTSTLIITNTPTTGQVLTATGSTTATWQNTGTVAAGDSPAGFNPDAMTCQFEDFVSYDVGIAGTYHGGSMNFLYTNANSATIGPSSTFVASTAGSNAIGVAALSTVASSGHVSIFQGSDSFLAGIAALQFIARVRISAAPTSGQDYISYIGFMDTPTAGAPVDGCYFKIDRTAQSNRWVAVCRSNSVETVVDSGVNFSTSAFQKLFILINAAGTSVQFQINGTTVATITTNIPSGAGRWFSLGFKHTKIAGSTSISLYIDYLQWCATYSSTRA